MNYLSSVTKSDRVTPVKYGYCVLVAVDRHHVRQLKRVSN